MVLPLRVPLSTAEISLNGTMVMDDTEWYSMVFSGIPLPLFSKGNENITADYNQSKSHFRLS